jgi:DNA-binding MarR family transcriptional regulator
VRHAPTESYIAAHRIAGKVNGMHRLVIDTIAEQGPMTCGELEKRLGLKHQTVSARLHDLEGKNRRYKGPVLLYRTGARRDGSGVYALIESQDPQPQGQLK